MNILFSILCIAVFFLMILFAFGMLKLTSDRIGFFEDLCRNRQLGVIIGFPLICWCVPHTQAIIFAWAEPYLWYAAVILAVLSYFYLDYLFARALGGAFIIGAYYFVHAAYEFQVSGAVVLTILAWLWGIAGIIISGKPSLLRDFFRKSANNIKIKNASYVFFGITGIIFIYSAIGELLK